MPRSSEPSLCNRVREIRTATPGCTQQQLADEIGVTRQTIVALERGAYTPSLALALRLAKFFKTSIEDLFWFEE